MNSSTQPAANLREIVRTFHEEARSETGSITHAPASQQLQSRAELLARLQVSFDDAYRSRGLVGRMPPAPSTLRAKAGALLVRLVQRMLFWYTPQIQRFQIASVENLHFLCELARIQHRFDLDFAKRFEQAQAHISALNTESLAFSFRGADRAVRPACSTAGAGSVSNSKPDLLPDAFYYALMDRFRGSVAETSAKLRPYLELIETVPEATESSWLDVGCGRGEWLAMCAAKGYRALGIDSNAVAVAICREKGLAVVEADASEYLGELDTATVGVLTAFHVLEHWPISRTLRFLTEAARVIRPGGLLIVETPQVNNLLAATRDFWLDPTHYRPIPAPLMEFMFEFCGLQVLQRLELQPHPADSRLPFEELEFVRLLNEHLHGPEAYGLVGQKKS